MQIIQIGVGMGGTNIPLDAYVSDSDYIDVYNNDLGCSVGEDGISSCGIRDTQVETGEG